jgi:hypothetical protein
MLPPMMVRATVLLWCVLFGCGGQRPESSSPGSSSKAGQAEAFARQCIEAEPERFKSVGGSPLVPEQARAVRRFEDARWLVHVPEESPTTKPTGRDLYVAEDGPVCSAAPMD